MPERQDPADMIRYVPSDVTFNDPESEALLRDLAEIIDSELGSQIAMQRSPTDPKERWDISGLLADAILDSFVVRKRIGKRVSFPQSQAE